MRAVHVRCVASGYVLLAPRPWHVSASLSASVPLRVSLSVSVSMCASVTMSVFVSVCAPVTMSVSVSLRVCVSSCLVSVSAGVCGCSWRPPPFHHCRVSASPSRSPCLYQQPLLQCSYASTLLHVSVPVVYTYAPAHLRARINLRVRVRVHVCVCVYVHVCIRVCIRACVCA